MQARRIAAAVLIANSVVALASGGNAELTPAPLVLSANVHTIGVRAPFGTSDGAAGNTAAIEYCLPSTIDGGAVPAARDAFKCYPAKTAKGTPRFATRTVTVTYESAPRQIAVQKPSSYCTAARADGTAIVDGAARLACYRAKIGPGAPRFTSYPRPTGDAYGAHDLVAVKPHTLCIPAAEIP